MEQLFEKIFSHYGPAALGWGFALLLWWDLREARKTLEKVITESTGTLATLTAFLRGKLEKGGD